MHAHTQAGEPPIIKAKACMLCTQATWVFVPIQPGRKLLLSGRDAHKHVRANILITIMDDSY